MALISFKSLTTSIVALTALAGSAQATLFSFASDDDSSNFTFRGTAATGNSFSIVNGRDPQSTPLTLKIDDNNGALPTVSLSVGFRANFTARWEGSVGLAGAQTHVYRVLGSFSFVNPNTGATLLTGTVSSDNSPAAMTVLGTTTAWGSSGSIFGSDTAYNFAGAVVWSATADFLTYAQSSAGANLLSYGVAAGASNAPDDFSFTLTDLNSSGGNVPINSTTRLPTSAWSSESSFSGTALNGIPSPGAVAVLGLAGLVAFGRRRRA